MPSIDFNPRSRWPFSAFFSSSPVAVSPPSPPPNCSCNFLGGHSEEAHSHGQSFWHQCHPRASGFAPPSPQLSQRTHLAAAASPKTVDIAKQGTLPISGNKSGTSTTNPQKNNDGAGKTRTSEYLESGFFNKDDGISRPTPEVPHDFNGNGNVSQLASRKDSVGDRDLNNNPTPTVESSNPVTPPNKVWRRASTSKVASTESNGNHTWLHRSTRPLDKPWRRDYVPTVGYSSLKSRAAGDRAGYISSTKNKPASIPILADSITEPKRNTTVLGCSQCLSEPKLKVSPCGCLICLTCGGRYWGAGPSGSDVYCGCGEVRFGIYNFCIRHLRPSGSLLHDQFRCH